MLAGSELGLAGGHSSGTFKLPLVVAFLFTHTCTTFSSNGAKTVSSRLTSTPEEEGGERHDEVNQTTPLLCYPSNCRYDLGED